LKILIICVAYFSIRNPLHLMIMMRGDQKGTNNLVNYYQSIGKSTHNIYAHMIDSEGFTVSYHQRLDVEESVESYTCQKMPKIGQDNILLRTTWYLSLFIKSWPPFNKAKSRSHSVDTRSCFWCHMRLNTMEKSSNTSACLCTHSLTCLCNFDQNTLHTQ